MDDNAGIGLKNRFAVFLEEDFLQADALEIKMKLKKPRKKSKLIFGETKENETGSEKVNNTSKGQGSKKNESVKLNEKKKEHELELSKKVDDQLEKVDGKEDNKGKINGKQQKGGKKNVQDECELEGEVEKNNDDFRKSRQFVNSKIRPPKRRELNEISNDFPTFDAGKPEKASQLHNEKPIRNRSPGNRPSRSRSPDSPDKGSFGAYKQKQDSRADRPLHSDNQRRERPFRKFDRKSGSDKTGVKAVDKKEGGGAHNWGIITEELPLNEMELSDDLKTEENINIEPVKEETQELTLDEWRARRGKRDQPQFNVRKAGEGEDLSKWKNMYEIKKKTDDNELVMENLQRASKQKSLLDIDIVFADSRRAGFDRPRGPQRGKPKVDESQTIHKDLKSPPLPQVDDELNFPALN